jgi:sarcosine oxidase subunit beta
MTEAAADMRADRDIPAPARLKPGYDVVIVGGGGHGCATAYYLAKRFGARRVAVLERAYLGGGNTARNTTIIRSNYSTPVVTRFFMASVEMYRTLSAELDFNIMFSPRGHLILANTEGTLRAIRRRCELNRFLGGRSEMLDADAVYESVPALAAGRGRSLPIVGAYWHADGATARHDAVVWGYVKQASRLGVEFHQRSEVQAIEPRPGGFRITTSRGVVEASAVLQATAGRSSETARLVGVALPIQTIPLQAMVTLPYKPFLDPIVSVPDLHLYVLQSARGELVIGGDSDPAPLYSTRSTLDWKQETAACLLDVFPFLSEMRVLRQWAGATDVTPDASPILGRTPIDNYWISAGWGTWGFKAIPAAGAAMAEAIATGTVPELIEPFALHRFERLQLLNELGSTSIAH